ncbi:MAG: class I SAM-dependent methyltransferase [Ferruginibacter sp.]
MDSYKITFENWDKAALQYQEKFMDLALYDDTYDIFCTHIKKTGARILEIGCGPGNITRYLLSKKPDLNIEAIDIAPSMIELAKINNPTANFMVMDCREIDKLGPGYDAIMCGFCMPYISKDDCAKLVKDCALLLNKEGILYFSAIEADYNKSGYTTSSDGKYKMYLYYHQEDYLQEYLKENNFELLSLQRKEYEQAAEASSGHMIFIARKI